MRSEVNLLKAGVERGDTRLDIALILGRTRESIASKVRETFPARRLRPCELKEPSMILSFLVSHSDVAWLEKVAKARHTTRVQRFAADRL